MSNIVKSVEFFDFTLVSTTTTSGVLSKSQDISNCVPFVSARGNSNSLQAHMMDVFFSSAGGNNYVNVERINSNGTQYCKVYVIEFDSNEIDVQQGSFSFSGSSSNVSITEVDLNYAAMVFYHKSPNNNRADYTFLRGKFSSSSQLEFRKGASSGSLNGHYYVFEAKNQQFSVESHDWSCASSTNVSFNTPLSNVRGLLVSSYYSDYTANAPSYIFSYSTRRNRRTVSVAKFSGSSTSYGTSFFISFNDDKRHTQRRYVSFSNSDTTKQYDLDYVVNLNSSMAVSDNIQSMCSVNTTAGNYVNNGFVSCELTTASGLEVKRGGSGTAGNSYVQVFDWNGLDIPEGNNLSPLASGISCAKSVENTVLTISGHERYTEYILTKGQNINNCVPFASSYGTANDFSRQMYNIWFESPSLVCVERGGLDSTSYINLNVVEFYPEQVKVRSNSILITDNYSNISISPVDRKKTALMFHGSPRDNSTTRADASLVRGRFTTSSGIEFYRYNSSSWWIGTYYTFEDLGSVFEVEQHEGSFTTYSRDISSLEMEPNTTFLIGSYASSYNSSAPSYVCARLTYQGIRTVGFNKSSSASTGYYCVFIIKFIDNREHVQNIYQYLNNSTSSATQSLYPKFVGHTNSITVYVNTRPGGTNSTTTGSYLNDSWCMITLISDDTLEISIGSNGGVNVSAAFSVIDWVGYAPQLEDTHKYGNNRINSIERMTLTLAGNEYQASKYISKRQNLNNCVPFFSLKSSSGNDGTYESMVAPFVFANSKKISLCRGQYTSGMDDIDMHVDIVEFNPKYIKVQKGDFYVDATYTDVSIDTIDLNRAFVVTSFYGYGISNYYNTSFLESYFKDDHTLTLKRHTDDAGVITGQYFIVEALQEEFYVQTIRASSSSTTAKFSYSEYVPDPGRTLLIGSYSSDYGGNAPSYGCAYIYRDIQYIYCQKGVNNSTNSYTIFAIEFNNYNKMDVSVQQRIINFNNSTSSATVGINKVDENKTCLVSSTAPINATVSTTSSNYFNPAFSKFTLTSSGTEVKREIVNDGVSSNSAIQIIEFPEPNKYYFEGTVTEQGSPAAGRQVRAYRKDTGYLVDETISASGTGYFYLETTYSGTHDIVCLDDLSGYSYNDLIYGDVIPTTISGL